MGGGVVSTMDPTAGRSGLPTPFYQQGSTTLFVGDCRDVLAGLPDDSVDLIFTSPPYNLGVTTGGGFNKNMRNLVGCRKGSKWDAPALAFGYGEHDDAMPYAEY